MKYIVNSATREAVRRAIKEVYGRSRDFKRNRKNK